MRQTIAKSMAGLFGMVTLVGCAQLFVAGQGEQKNASSLEGVWQTVVTLRNCANGNPLPVPPFPGILMFNQGGTMTGTSTAVTSVYGTWKREPGLHQYSFKSLSLKYDAAGVLIGSRRITQNVTLADGNTTLTTNGGFQDYDLDGNLTVAGCSTATGTRFE